MRPSQSQPTSLTLSTFFFLQYCRKAHLQKAAFMSHVSLITRLATTAPQPCFTSQSSCVIQFLAGQRKAPKISRAGFLMWAVKRQNWALSIDQLPRDYWKDDVLRIGFKTHCRIYRWNIKPWAYLASPSMPSSYQTDNHRVWPSPAYQEVGTNPAWDRMLQGCPFCLSCSHHWLSLQGYTYPKQGHAWEWKGQKQAGIKTQAGGTEGFFHGHTAEMPC